MKGVVECDVSSASINIFETVVDARHVKYYTSYSTREGSTAESG